MEDNDTICLKENKNYSQYKDDYTSTQLHKDDAYQMSTYYSNPRVHYGVLVIFDAFET